MVKMIKYIKLTSIMDCNIGMYTIKVTDRLKD